jgi:hypothetical protein
MQVFYLHTTKVQLPVATSFFVTQYFAISLYSTLTATGGYSNGTE